MSGTSIKVLLGYTATAALGVCLVFVFSALLGWLVSSQFIYYFMRVYEGIGVATLFEVVAALVIPVLMAIFIIDMIRVWSGVAGVAGVAQATVYIISVVCCWLLLGYATVSYGETSISGVSSLISISFNVLSIILVATGPILLSILFRKKGSII